MEDEAGRVEELAKEIQDSRESWPVNPMRIVGLLRELERKLEEARRERDGFDRADRLRALRAEARVEVLEAALPKTIRGFLGRLVGFSMLSREKEWSGRDNRVYISLDAFHESPAMARTSLADGRQVVVQDAEGRLLFVLGMPMPDPFPITEDELCDVVKAARRALSPQTEEKP